MEPAPRAEHAEHSGCEEKLRGKVAIITGGDSGIGRAVAILFAKEGADIVIVYKSEHKDAEDTAARIRELGGECIAMAGDVGDEAFCKSVIDQTIGVYGHIDILINNAAEQHVVERIDQITEKQLTDTFRTNIFSYFFMAKAALPELIENKGVIVNTTSVTAYRGSPSLLDYSSTKGAIVAFTRSLALQLIKEGVRVNAVAPGPIWTPLIPSTFPEEKIPAFGEQVPMGRAGEPDEVAFAFLYLASYESAYMTGQVLHPNGGEIING